MNIKININALLLVVALWVAGAVVVLGAVYIHPAFALLPLGLVFSGIMYKLFEALLDDY